MKKEKQVPGVLLRLEFSDARKYLSPATPQ